MSQETGQTVDIIKVMDEAPTSRLVIQVAILCAGAALLDGSNTTNIGIVAPIIAEKLQLSSAQIGAIFSAGTLGAMVGALTFGPLSDRFGRKRMLVIATLAFGIFTAVTGLTETFSSLLVARVLAGIGLGGATPCFIALASEYAPKSRRAMVTTLIWSAFPLGVILGAILNAFLLANSTWQSIFLIGGVLSLIISAAMLLWLPESMRFLLLRKPNSAEIGRIVSRILPSLPSGARIIGHEEKTTDVPIQSLFSREGVLETLLVWIAFMASFGMTAATFFWSPILMHNHGFSLPEASMIVGAGAGTASLVGAAGAGKLVEKFGSTKTLAITFLLATLSTSALGYAAASPVLMIIVVVANGLLIAGISTASVLALSAMIYPTAIRSTGVGWAVGAGKLGEVFMPFLIGVLMTFSAGVSDEVFLVIALVPLLGAISILLLNWRNSRLASAQRVPVSGHA